MLRGMKKLTLTALVLGLAGTWAFAETVEEVEKKITEASKKATTITCKQKSEHRMEQEQFSTLMTSEGTFEQTRQGDKVMMRQEGTAHTTMKMAGNETKNETKSLFVSDGTTAWSLTDTDGQKFCTKTKIPSETDAFETMRKDFTGKVLPDEKVDGADCYVLEYTPKAAADAGAAPGTATRYVYYYRKDCGLAVKTVLFTADGKPMMTTTLSDIKLGGKVDESHFKFEPPAGVQVMDTTAPQP